MAGAYGYYASAGYPYLIGVVDSAEACTDMQLAPVRATAGAPVELSLCTSSSRLERVHERPVHLIVISGDLNNFAHLHPEQQSSAHLWRVTHTFPSAGLYRLYAEYTPAGGEPRVARFIVNVEGSSQPSKEEAKPTWLSMKHAAPRAGEDVAFEFSVNEALEPYLGAWAHFVVIGEDGGEFLHAHPAEEMGLHSHAMGASPERITTTIGFERPGRYKLWAQFQRAGEVTVVSWALNVAPGTPAEMTPTAGAIAIRVTRSGYEPARIPIVKGQAVQLAFIRADAANCGSSVIFPDLGIRRDLPAGQTTLVELPASNRDELRFSCGMGMLKGALVAAPLRE